MKILIHIGPPKSGTSAIQKWLIENQAELQSQGIFYPQHQSDSNGISSGNMLSLFSWDNYNRLIFDKNKKTQLLSDFANTKLTTLLLSSEFFFQQIVTLAAEFPTALFVAYLRFPVDVIESSYNQGVKRHGEIRRLGVPETPRLSQLNTLERSIKRVGSGRFVLRPFHDFCFEGNSLINDFKDVLKIPIDINDKKLLEKVNSSYALDALEFKRWFNQFPLGELQHHLDQFLQAYSENKSAYSLVPSKVFNNYKSEYIKVMEHFCDSYHVNNSKCFIKNCHSLTQKTIKKQNISLDTFETLYCNFLERVPEIRNTIFEKVIIEWSSMQDIKVSERLDILHKHIPLTTRIILHFKRLVCRLKGSCHR